jgi:hypothetical protein
MVSGLDAATHASTACQATHFAKTAVGIPDDASTRRGAGTARPRRMAMRTTREGVVCR